MKRNNRNILNSSWAFSGSLVIIPLLVFLFGAMAPKLMKVHGQITNGTLPVEKARVQLYKKNRLVGEARTDMGGLFELHAKSGTYFIRIYSVIKDTSFQITLKRNSDLELNVSLGKEPIAELVVDEFDLEEPEPKKEAGEVVTSDYIEVGEVSKLDEAKDKLHLKLNSDRHYSMGLESATPPMMDGAATPRTTESAYPYSSTQVSAKSGTLTAGELNDFTKFEMWTDLSEGTLKAHVSEWGMKPSERYTLLLTNEESGAVVSAQVSLQTKEGDVVWTTSTNNAGRADLWSNLYSGDNSEGPYQVVIEYLGNSFKSEDLVAAENGINHLQLPVSCYNPTNVDIAFVVDATGSMSDEIAYLQAELEDVISEVKVQNESLDIRTSSVFYRDHTDEYVTRESDFSDDLSATTTFIKEQSAKGGGDMPEAVDAALEQAVLNFSWSKESRAKLLFLVLDAPPHNDLESMQRMKTSIDAASKLGIRIIPIVGSGTGKSTEYLMRSIALATGGTYIFLTDHSGVGGSHMAPSTDAYDVTYLNSLMKEVIARYTMASSCHNDAPTIAQDGKVIIEHVKGSEKTYPENREPFLELSLENKILETSGNVNDIAKDEQKEIDRLKEEAEIEEKAIYSLFPNPTSGVLNVFTSEPQQRILLLDMSGKLLREFNSNDQLQFAVNVSEYPPGMYFIGFYADDKMHTERFVLSK